MEVLDESLLLPTSAQALPTLLKPDSAPTVSCGERQNLKAFDAANKLALIFFR